MSKKKYIALHTIRKRTKKGPEDIKPKTLLELTEDEAKLYGAAIEPYLPDVVDNSEPDDGDEPPAGTEKK